jgi:hypothetical protein
MYDAVFDVDPQIVASPRDDARGGGQGPRGAQLDF